MLVSLGKVVDPVGVVVAGGLVVGVVVPEGGLITNGPLGVLTIDDHHAYIMSRATISPIEMTMGDIVQD